MYHIRVVFWFDWAVILFWVVFIYPGHYYTSLVLDVPLSGCLHFVQVLSELVCTLSGLFTDQSGFFLNLSWYLQHLFRVVCASSRFFLNLYVPHPGCFLINPGSFWICLGTCSTSSGLFALRPGSFWICMYLIRVVFWSIRVVSGLALRSVFSWSHGTDVALLHVKHKNML